MSTEIEITILFRALVAALLGFLIGWERMSIGAAVRWRVITLTTMTSAAVTAVGVEMYAAQTSRIVAGIVTGIGFLGAGVILRSSTGEVRGQTTAAALWAMSCIGIIIGSGHVILGVVLTLAVYLIVAWGDWPIVTQLNERLKKRNAKDIESQQMDETNKKDEKGDA